MIAILLIPIHGTWTVLVSLIAVFDEFWGLSLYLNCTIKDTSIDYLYQTYKS